jgi:hypothetical protein
MDAYVFSSDYRLNASVNAPHFFPSSNTTYCEASDETCKACWSSPLFTAAFSGVRDPSAFCVGAGGCVCVAFCESNSYSQVVLDRFCDVATSSAGAASATGSSAISREWGTDSVSAMASSSLRLIGLIVALCVAIPAVVVVWYGQRGKKRSEFGVRCRQTGPLTFGILQVGEQHELELWRGATGRPPTVHCSVSMAGRRFAKG